jgi:hypothetical protein
VLRQMNAEDWIRLRMLVREPGGTLTGRKLRFVPSRRTKDGTFLDKLVETGLLEVVSVDPKPDKSSGEGSYMTAVQFRTHYKLTDLGKKAAEYGEYTAPDKVRSSEPDSTSAVPKPKKTKTKTKRTSG